MNYAGKKICAVPVRLRQILSSRLKMSYYTVELKNAPKTLTFIQNHIIKMQVSVLIIFKEVRIFLNIFSALKHHQHLMYKILLYNSIILVKSTE